ncbi:hypothetical protein DFJ73DRAFT_912822, partial [Zopfochytrium polystomum]
RTHTLTHTRTLARHSTDTDTQTHNLSPQYFQSTMTAAPVLVVAAAAFTPDGLVPSDTHRRRHCRRPAAPPVRYRVLHAVAVALLVSIATFFLASSSSSSISSFSGSWNPLVFAAPTQDDIINAMGARMNEAVQARLELNKHKAQLDAFEGAVTKAKADCDAACMAEQKKIQDANNAMQTAKDNAGARRIAIGTDTSLSKDDKRNQQAKVATDLGSALASGKSEIASATNAERAHQSASMATQNAVENDRAKLIKPSLEGLGIKSYPDASKGETREDWVNPLFFKTNPPPRQVAHRNSEFTYNGLPVDAGRGKNGRGDTVATREESKVRILSNIGASETEADFNAVKNRVNSGDLARELQAKLPAGANIVSIEAKDPMVKDGRRLTAGDKQGNVNAIIEVGGERMGLIMHCDLTRRDGITITRRSASGAGCKKRVNAMNNQFLGALKKNKDGSLDLKSTLRSAKNTMKGVDINKNRLADGKKAIRLGKAKDAAAKQGKAINEASCDVVVTTSLHQPPPPLPSAIDILFAPFFLDPLVLAIVGNEDDDDDDDHDRHQSNRPAMPIVAAAASSSSSRPTAAAIAVIAALRLVCRRANSAVLAYSSRAAATASHLQAPPLDRHLRRIPTGRFRIASQSALDDFLTRTSAAATEAETARFLAEFDDDGDTADDRADKPHTYDPAASVHALTVALPPDDSDSYVSLDTLADLAALRLLDVSARSCALPAARCPAAFPVLKRLRIAQCGLADILRWRIPALLNLLAAAPALADLELHGRWRTTPGDTDTDADADDAPPLAPALRRLTLWCMELQANSGAVDVAAAAAEVATIHALQRHAPGVEALCLRAYDRDPLTYDSYSGAPLADCAAQLRAVAAWPRLRELRIVAPLPMWGSDDSWLPALASRCPSLATIAYAGRPSGHWGGGDRLSARALDTALHALRAGGGGLRKLELQHVDWVERDPELRAVLQYYGVEVVLLPAASGAFD